MNIIQGPSRARQFPSSRYNPESFRPTLRGGDLRGLFWLMPVFWQVARVRELGRTFSAEYISILTRVPVATVQAILEWRS